MNYYYRRREFVIIRMHRRRLICESMVKRVVDAGIHCTFVDLDLRTMAINEITKYIELGILNGFNSVATKKA